MLTGATRKLSLVDINSFLATLSVRTTAAQGIFNFATADYQFRSLAKRVSVPRVPRRAIGLQGAEASRFFGTVRYLSRPRRTMNVEERSEQVDGQVQGAKKARGGKGGGGRSGVGGAGGGGPQKREKDISRALSRLLRHQALNAGIKLDKEGYAPLDKVVSLSTLSIPSQRC